MRRRSGKPKCHWCGGPAVSTVRASKTSRRIGKQEGDVFKPRPICLEKACWQKFWDESPRR